MKQFFNKSWIMIMFYTVIYTVIILGAAILKYRYSVINTETTDAENIIIDDKNSDYALIIKIIIFVTLLMLINVWIILDYWLESKKIEYFVRKLSGATDEKIIYRIILNYGGLIAISFFMSLVLVFIIKLFPLFISRYIYLSVGLCAISYCSMLVAGIIMGSWKVSRFVRKELTILR